MSEDELACSRRALLGGAMTVGLGTMLSARATGAQLSARSHVIDTNVSLFQWPFRRLPLDDPQRLAERLQKLGVAQAWAGSYEAVLHRDLAGVNERIVEACERFDLFVPIGAINPTLPDWEEDLRRCVEVHQMPGVRLYPAYHGYELNDARFAELLKGAAEAKCFVQVCVSLEDVRTQHPLVRVEDVDLSALPQVLSSNPPVRIQLLNARIRGALLERLALQPRVYLDVARVDGTDGITALLRSLPAGRVLLGSHAPFLIPDSVLIRTAESGLTEDELRALLWENAENVWTPA